MSNSIGCLIVDIAGLTLTAEDRLILAHPLVGGVILFARNYVNRAQMINLCQEVRAVRKQPLLLMVDQEGGRVQRFVDEFTRLPAMGAFGDLYERHPEDALKLTKDCGWLMATEVLSVGIDMSLAPVLDCHKGMNSVVGRRAFHQDPHVVSQLANAFIEGMQRAGMGAVGKHFPGHGAVTIDSHIGLPQDERDYHEIEAADLSPFVAMIRAGIVGMMMSHILFPKIDPVPIGYSYRWITEILKKKLGFSGVILSDDLNMAGANLTADFCERVRITREAGVDFALLCNNRAAVIQVLDGIPANQQDKQQVAAAKWQRLRGDFKQAEANRLGDACKKLSVVISNMQ